jgi:creatinine amidohydrolase
MGHACELETSMMLALRPELVHIEEIVDDPDLTPDAVQSIFWARDFGRRTDHGAVGYPSFATAEKGRRMLEASIGAVTKLSQALLELPIG